MKKHRKLPPVIALLIAVCMFIVFYGQIGCKPDQAGFWLVLVLGMSFGVGITTAIQWLQGKK